MPTADNETIVRRLFEEVWNQGNLDVADELIASDGINHDPTSPDQVGPAAFKQFVGMYRTAFPDVHFAIDELIAQGDTVVARWTATGTHQGPLQGIPPTGQRATVAGVVVAHLQKGKARETWAFWDTQTFMRQLGLSPQIATAGITQPQPQPPVS